MKKTIFILALCAAAMAGCGRDEIKTYDGAEYIQFGRSFADSVSFSFLFAGGSDSYDYPVDVELVGQGSAHDRSYRVEVLEDYTTAPAGSYVLPSEFTLAGGKFADTFHVKLVNLPELADGTERLALRVISTDDLLVGETERSVLILRFTDMVTQPAWWNSTIVNSYLGAYSDKKYRLFVEVTGEYDLAGMDQYWLRRHTLTFKQWLREEDEAGRTVYEADGTTPMTVAVIGG